MHKEKDLDFTIEKELFFWNKYKFIKEKISTPVHLTIKEKDNFLIDEKFVIQCNIVYCQTQEANLNTLYAYLNKIYDKTLQDKEYINREAKKGIPIACFKSTNKSGHYADSNCQYFHIKDKNFNKEKNKFWKDLKEDKVYIYYKAFDKANKELPLFNSMMFIDNPLIICKNQHYQIKTELSNDWQSLINKRIQKAVSLGQLNHSSQNDLQEFQITLAPLLFYIYILKYEIDFSKDNISEQKDYISLISNAIEYANIICDLAKPLELKGNRANENLKGKDLRVDNSILTKNINYIKEPTIKNYAKLVIKDFHKYIKDMNIAKCCPVCDSFFRKGKNNQVYCSEICKKQRNNEKSYKNKNNF